MSRRPRNTIMTSFFHVMTQGINKSYIFEEENEIKYYIKTMNKAKNQYNVKVIAYCIMNNHAHILVNVEKVEILSEFMRSLNTQYARYYNKKHNRVGYVFRDRYKSEGIYTEKQMYNCISYIYNNPVKARICSTPEDYPYSNYKENIYKLQEVDIDYDFIDVDDDKKSLREIIDYYIGENDINSIMESEKELRKMVDYLKNKKGISYRKMENELGIGRERLRALLK